MDYDVFGIWRVSRERCATTESFNSYEKKKEANIEEIKKRLKGRSLSQNFRFFAYDKQVRTWGDSTFSCCDYLSREPKNPDGFLEKFVTMDGSKNWMLLLYIIALLCYDTCGNAFVCLLYSEAEKLFRQEENSDFCVCSFYAWNRIVSDNLGM